MIVVRVELQRERKLVTSRSESCVICFVVYTL